jgi:hypothetical protein
VSFDPDPPRANVWSYLSKFMRLKAQEA